MKKFFRIIIWFKKLLGERGNSCGCFYRYYEKVLNFSSDYMVIYCLFVYCCFEYFNFFKYVIKILVYKNGLET